ncbi:Rieske (2Fe-2S) protein [Halobaculum sp. D14]|uniref:Rieske (2Fe-2S) protein n=1 Tax=unclassified Halobaculum TaxID=2640896 RepID=UPI003EBEC668
MTLRQELTSVESVHDSGSWLFTVMDTYGREQEFILVPCEDGVEAWRNQCTHEPQRFDRGNGAAVRDGELVCPRHGSMFDTCSGYCDNGKAADTTLGSADVDCEDGTVYLTDDAYEFAHAGGVDAGDDDSGPSSTSHLSF